MVREFAPPAQTMFRAPANGARDSVTPFASTNPPYIGLEVPARGDYPNQWDLPMDATLTTLDNMAGGVASITATGGNQVITLTPDQANRAVLLVGGTLSGGYTLIQYPQGYGCGKKWVIPNCGGISPTGNYLYVRGYNDNVGVYFWNAWYQPHGILVTPNRVWWDYGGSFVGDIKMAATGFLPNGFIPLDARMLNTTAHDLLFNLYGYGFGGSGSSFQVPDCRGMVMAGADNMGTAAGNRGILNNWGILGSGAPLGEANHQITVAEMPGHNHPGSYDSGHAHTASEVAHSHTIPGSFGYGVGAQAPPSPLMNGSGTTTTSSVAATVNVNQGTANIVVASQGNWNAHNNVQPTRTCMALVRW